MSHAATAWAFSIRGLSPTQRIVLYQLANRCNEGHKGFEGRSVCWPSISRLVDDCELSRRTIFNAIGAMEKHGLIVRDSGKGYEPATGPGGSSTIYGLAIQRGPQVVQNMHQPKKPSGARDGGKVVHVDTGSGAPNAPKSSNKSVKGMGKGSHADKSIHDQEERIEETGAFAEFWEAYPRRVGKVAAAAEYDKALIGATHDQIMAGVKAYARVVGSWGSEEDQYIKYPENWLKEARYGDDMVGASEKGIPLNVPDGWDAVIAQLGVKAWNSWLANCHIVKNKPQNRIEIYAGTEFRCDYIINNYADTISRVIGEKVAVSADAGLAEQEKK